MTVGVRAAYLAETLRKRNRKLLNIPYWAEWELEEMAPHMRRHIEMSVSLKNDLMSRIEHCEFVASISPSIAEVWMAVDAEELEHL